MSGPLQGCKVIELAHIMAGPVCGLMLADMGADVIKVEKVQGDDSRRFIPPEINGESAAFMMMNRNKRGMVLDLKKSDARDILRRMIRDADVLIENYRADTMEKLGLSYDSLREINTGLIYCEISGFGRTGPYATRGGFDLIAQGMSGLMSITGEGPGRPPVKVGAPVTDITAGILGAMGVAAAYAHKLKTGEGQKVDTSLFEAGIVHTYWQSAITFATGEPPGALGSAHPLNAPYQAFETKDGWVNIGAANQTNWERMITALDAQQLNEDPRFSSNKGRIENRLALEEVLAPLFRAQKTASWLEKFEEIGVPAGPVLSIAEMHEDPHALARDMIVETDHRSAGRVKTIGHPVKYSQTPAGVRQPAPIRGQHTKEILSELGYDESMIEKFLSDGSAFEDDTA